MSRSRVQNSRSFPTIGANTYFRATSANGTRHSLGLGQVYSLRPPFSAGVRNDNWRSWKLSDVDAYDSSFPSRVVPNDVTLLVFSRVLRYIESRAQFRVILSLIQDSLALPKERERKREREKCRIVYFLFLSFF